ncbi:MAG: sugar phosphate nucleotidyltransferase [Candidatus Pacebacteria bacterium]|nr:sugar phosphate nucleotidyltransferase [Candidatus Paceibacterota bacterium]
MNSEVKKAIFPIAGMGTRFLPLSKIISKELIPLVDKPLVQYSVQEAYDSGIEKIEFVTRTKQKEALDYFSRNEKLEQLLIDRNKKEELDLLRSVDFDIEFSSSIQKKASGDANAIYQSLKFVGDEPCGVFFCDDIIYSQEPGLAQLIEVYKNCQRPVLALKRLPVDKLSGYGVIDGEKIANGFYKVRRVAQKPRAGEAPSDLAIMGRMILTPDVFDYLTKNKALLQKDCSITQILGMMAEEGKPVYGYEIKGEWLECGTRSLWLKSFLTLLLDNPEFGPEIKQFLKNHKI